jgi:4-amino-4-deoxy-L-arabinose transferase-like glycosyltransferase
VVNARGKSMPRMATARHPAVTARADADAFPADRVLALAGLVAVCGLAAVLRFSNFDAVYTTPYYDAAVRSMSLSWHNFLYGALEPSGQISIDKTPVDLWLQVASVRLLGFSSVALRLPPAIAGTLSVALLYDLVRRGCGRWAGLAAALALAVLPSALLTSRSDTMDTVMATLLLAAAWVIVRVRPERRAIAVVAAGALAGLAFEVKLFEATVALPALALIAWLALQRRRVRTFVLATLAYLVAASSWAVVASLLPGPHPYPLGSTNGQIWNALLVYNGLHRLGVAPTSATAPGLTRLFDPSLPRQFGILIGGMLLVALAWGALALLTARRHASRTTRAVVCGLGAWLVIGALVTSFMGRLWPRYLEAFTPAVAGVMGIAIVAIARGAARNAWGVPVLCASAAVAAIAAPATGIVHGTAVTVSLAAAAGSAVLAGACLIFRRRSTPLAGAAAALALLAALAVPTVTSVRLVSSGRGDSAGAGKLPPSILNPLSSYLRAHQGGARYEEASASIVRAASLVVRDARPVLTLAGVYGRPLLTPHQLVQRVRAGQVRYAQIGHVTCVAGIGVRCAPVVRWVQAHGIDVSHAAGLPHKGMLYRLGPPAIPRAPHSRSRIP